MLTQSTRNPSGGHLLARFAPHRSFPSRAAAVRVAVDAGVVVRRCARRIAARGVRSWWHRATRSRIRPAVVRCPTARPTLQGQGCPMPTLWPPHGINDTGSPPTPSASCGLVSGNEMGPQAGIPSPALTFPSARSALSDCAASPMRWISRDDAAAHRGPCEPDRRMLRLPRHAHPRTGDQQENDQAHRHHRHMARGPYFTEAERPALTPARATRLLTGAGASRPISTSATRRSTPCVGQIASAAASMPA